jgi:DNA-binding NarL/FixJ family response regulator
MSKPVKILVYEDSPAMADSIRLLLEGYDQITCVGLFEQANNISFEVSKLKPDVILLDINMPGISGIDAARICKRMHPDIPIIMQTIFEDDDNIFEAIKAGASGYILKKNLFNMLETAIRDVFEGGSPMSPGVARRVLHFLRTDSRQPETASIANPLSEREQEVLRLMVKGHSYKMAAETLNVSYHTINSHVKKIYEKLHVHSMTGAVSKALREGLLDS